MPTPWRLLPLALLLGVMPAAQAILPESGVYWHPGEPGRGYVIEHQDGLVFLLVFTYDPDTGEPVWYTSQGPLQLTPGHVHPEPGPPSEGFYPAHGLHGRIAKVKGGACLTCQHVDPQEVEEVGDVWLYFDYVGRTELEIRLDHPPIPPPPVHVVHWNTLYRFNLVRPWYGSSDPGFAHTRIQDLSGEWLFSDRSDPSAQPWRFVLSLVSHEQFDESGRVYTLVYSDPFRDAQVVCEVGHYLLLPPGSPQQAELPHSGCSFSLGGDVVFSALHWDIGLHRIEGFRGTLAPSGEGPLRRAERVIGVRVE